MNTATKEITLTCKLGYFVFDNDVVLSRAKLIRDAVMGQVFAPKPDQPRITNEDQAYLYARNHLSPLLAEIPFKVQFNHK